MPTNFEDMLGVCQQYLKEYGMWVGVSLIIRSEATLIVLPLVLTFSAPEKLFPQFVPDICIYM